ncbi:hypothetical protein [Actinomycetospora sp. TBRC 11914]|uniref:hypothetical protein n=1 Tax=Actinomycetospora sp. TBRC 11914 TaxID=2729387 RepID=UPI00145D3E8B|nr:hypothetical protein [Actinomycetospora sp. TBRC 11914]NMO92280.1 hypothetical protein [Actinomycetospora sp. TBRC 11914]
MASKPAPKPPKGATTPPKASASARSAPARPEASQVDVGAVARAVSTGFLILVFGGLVQPIVSTYVPLLGMFWLILVAVIAFASAGARVGLACPNPPLHGAGAAVISYLLVVPLMFLQGTFNPLYCVYSFVAAAVVGALAGRIAARSQAPRA